jgi:hypothetical protein
MGESPHSEADPQGYGNAAWSWLTATAPFSARGDPTAPARFVVEQVGDSTFAIPDGQGFQFNAPDGTCIVVDPSTLPTTDFASIPPFMSWFVSRYGRHTPAALVHDQLVVDGMPSADRREADRRFLEMMDDLQVPPVRSRIMWTAVSLATLCGSWRGRIAVGLWFLCAAGGIALLVHGLVTATWVEVAIALVAQIPLSLLWWPLWSAGIVAGYALPLVLLPAAASWLGYAAYSLVELGLKGVLKAAPRTPPIADAPVIKYREM